LIVSVSFLSRFVVLRTRSNTYCKHSSFKTLENTVSSHANASIFANTERNLRSTAVDVAVVGVVLSVAENKQT